ncbi:MAG: M14-type cytosolic carboxypeptidase, partial [Ktedonobacteraceae bacterium]
MPSTLIALLLLSFGAGVYPYSGIGVRTDFEGGSIGRVIQVSPTHLECAVKGQSDQDDRNRQADWYYLELTNLPQKPITVELVDLAGEYNYKGPAYSVDKGTRPVYSYDDVHWKHFTNSQVSWDGREHHLILQFTPGSDRIWIAHVTPYTNKNLARLLSLFHKSSYLRVRSVGHTVQGRKILLLTITNTEVPGIKKKVIGLMFRQHAWEAGSSWACEGALRFLLSSDDERAARIRDTVIFKIFPMADPDGVADGTVRYNQNGYDLNRNWDMLNKQKMPEIWYERKAVLGWVDSGHRLDLFLTLHNTETAEYLAAPSAFATLGERAFHLLVQHSSFNPTEPLRHIGTSTTPGTPGRMTVCQGLYHDRKLPAMIMEQMIEYNSKLGHVPTAADRIAFGGELVRALAQAVLTPAKTGFIDIQPTGLYKLFCRPAVGPTRRVNVSHVA